ncbi:MAG: chromosome segregation protein SMC [Pelolinea sp.]|nr:chromosome segregation protein SMC [Pelolinea sp.]
MINRLKALELQGYKTFANKTQFAFPGQITAVVGPNGSGKSNIADSIRWVLGEQAYSVLRGKKTVDMIFSGSEQRARASMASVSITFDNQNGWLPIDFSEVNITRRAYRDGENEYLLNNQRVRLKEINELLANSGLGDRTYTIIGQGLVDIALSLRPEERRKFFEEAAGIGLYRGRREEAVLKLDKTLRNMERVQDLVNELKPRIGLLLKNKEKASQFKQIQNDLHLLLQDWYGYHWHQTQKDLNYSVEFYNQQKAELEKVQIEKENLEEQLNQIQSNLNENRLILADLHKEIAAYHSETEEITRKIAVLDEREKTLRLRLSEITGEIENTSVQSQYIQAELTGLESTALQYKNEFQEVSILLDAASERLSQKLSEQQAKERRLSEIRKKIFSSESKLLNFGTSYKNNLREIEAKKTEIIKIYEYLKSIQESLEKLNTEKNELINNINSHNSIITSRDDEYQKIQAEVEVFQNKLNHFVDEKQKSTAYISKINAKLEVIKDAEEHLVGFNSGSAEVINASRTKLIPGNLALIIDHLIVPEKYEIAIAAALGEVLEGIILDSKIHVENILGYLEKQKITRTVLVPFDFEKKINSDNPYKGKNLTFADSIIGNDSRFSDVIMQLLGKTILVDERKAALELFAELQPGWKIITLSGEVFDSRGTISAGTEYRVKPLKRKREKNTLETEVIDSNKYLSEIESDITDNKTKSNLLKDNLNQIAGEIKKTKEKISSLNFESYKCDLERDQKIRIQQDEAKRKDVLEKQISNLEKDINTLQGQKILEEQNIKTLKLEEEKTIASENTNEIDELRKEVLELSSRKSVAEKLDLQHVQSLNKTKENSKAIERNRTNLELKHTDLKKNIEDTVITKKALQEQNDLVSEKIDGIATRITPLEEKVEAIIGVQGKILEDVDKGRRNFAIAERHTLQSQLKVEKIRDQLNSTKEKIEEDFGIINTSDETEYGFNQPLPLEGIVASLPKLTELPYEFEDQISQKKAYLRRIGPVNPEAEKEFDEANERYRFLTEQLVDLEKAEKDLRQVVHELDMLMKKEFMKTFKKVEEEFSNIFGQLFDGGAARLYIDDEENILDGGIEIEATLPGRRKQELGLLSGGERSLIAVALIFALLRISPTPFCILDEVDAMLDESNVVRFGELLRELSDTTQFIVITHNRNTVQLADVLYGVTMGKDSVSQVISLRMDELTDEMVQ